MLTTARPADRPSTPSVQLTTLMLAQIRMTMSSRYTAYGRGKLHCRNCTPQPLKLR